MKHKVSGLIQPAKNRTWRQFCKCSRKPPGSITARISLPPGFFLPELWLAFGGYKWGDSTFW